MIGFEPPQYYRIDGVLLACFTIQDVPGGQYTYHNRDLDWIEAYLDKLPHGGCYLSHYCGGVPTRVDAVSLQGLAEFWSAARVFPPDAGGKVRFGSDLRTVFLFYGKDESPERAWIADPLRLAFLGRIPYKTRQQRRRERKNPSHRCNNVNWCRSDLIRPHIPKYIYGFSRYEHATSQNQVGSSRSDG